MDERNHNPIQLTDLKDKADIQLSSDDRIDLKFSSDDRIDLQFSSKITPTVGGGNISSPDVSVIRVLDRADYDALETKNPATLYFVRG